MTAATPLEAEETGLVLLPAEESTQFKLKRFCWRSAMELHAAADSFAIPLLALCEEWPPKR
jgi:hypothetical protein